MLKTHWRHISRLERVADNSLIVAAFFLSYHLRDLLIHAASTWSFELPFELQYSMTEVKAQAEDTPYDSKTPLYKFGFGLRYSPGH